MGTRTEPRTQAAGSVSPTCRSASTAPFFLLILKLNAPGSWQMDRVLLSPENMPCQDWGAILWVD